MSIRTQIHEFDGMYFITITCYKWQCLFQQADGYPAVYNWFDYLKQSGHFINGYVIMPNHLHALISFSNTGKPINKIIGNGKRFMAYDLIQRLKILNREDLLVILRKGVKARDKANGKLHEVFEPSFDWKSCYGNYFIEQKLEYIHNNPCQERWSLVANPEDYDHSSSEFYSTGIHGVYEVTDYSEMEDIDLAIRRDEK